MAAIIASALPELEALLAGGGVGSTLARGALTGLAGFAAGDILNFLTGHPSAKTKVPPFALVDMHTNKVILYMGRRRAYRILLRPRRRAARTKIIREIIRENGSS